MLRSAAPPARPRRCAATARSPMPPEAGPVSPRIIHAAAYWLMHGLRTLAPKRSFWRDAQFDTIRISLLKVAARISEFRTRIRIALPTGYPYQASWWLLAERAA